jgi:hypothetical protein
MNVTELKAYAKSVGMTGYSKLRKNELITAIGDFFYDAAVTENRHRTVRKVAAGYKASIAEDAASLPQTLPKPRKGMGVGSATRLDNYLRQNGCERLTPAQRRRYRKVSRKRNNGYVPQGI